jgi:hypothetical protein
LSQRDRASIPERLQRAGGLRTGAARAIARETGVPEAEVYGVGSFYELLARPGTLLRVCTGLSCRLNGADAVFDAAHDAGLPVEPTSCLAACDRPRALLRDRRVLPSLAVSDIERADGDWRAVSCPGAPEAEAWRGCVGPEGADADCLAIDLAAVPDFSAGAYGAARALGAEADVMPSLLDALGIEPPAALEGQPLGGITHPIVTELHRSIGNVNWKGERFRRELRAIYEGSYKLVTSSKPDDPDAGFFDLEGRPRGDDRSADEAAQSSFASERHARRLVRHPQASGSAAGGRNRPQHPASDGSPRIYRRRVHKTRRLIQATIENVENRSDGRACRTRQER